MRCGEPLRALATGAQRAVERKMAEEVERIGVGHAGDLAEPLQVDAALRQRVENRLCAACVRASRFRAPRVSDTAP